MKTKISPNIPSSVSSLNLPNPNKHFSPKNFLSVSLRFLKFFSVKGYNQDSEKMAGGGASNKSSNGGGPTRVRKRVEVETAAAASLKRAKDGSAFARCEECSKDVPIALISFHNCSLDAKIKMNLEAQVVESQTEVKKPAVKSKEKTTEPKTKREKKPKNPNAPKRPPTAFFVFMDDFRQTFKAANPDCKSVSTVAKEGGEKWKSMSDEEKKPYQDKAAELKAAYEKALKSNTDADNANDEDEELGKEVKEEIKLDEE